MFFPISVYTVMLNFFSNKFCCPFHYKKKVFIEVERTGSLSPSGAPEIMVKVRRLG
jgi:hypothetical protein